MLERDVLFADGVLGGTGFVQRVSRPVGGVLRVAANVLVSRAPVAPGYHTTAGQLKSDFSATHGLLSAVR